MKYLSVLIIAVFVISCNNETKQKVNVLTANEIIDKSIEVSGGESFGYSKIFFGFRDKTFMARRNGGELLLVRHFKKDKDSITDIYDNFGFKRMINEAFVKVVDSMAAKYLASVNSVHYFSVLPYGLNDKAVNKTLLEDEYIKDKNYYKIKVTFNSESGGEDYEDIFVYWVDKEFYKVDYLAYSYNEADGIGMRFREAYNEHYVNGLRFVDYNNYDAKSDSIVLTELGKAYEKNELKLLSKIELENVEVNLIDN